MAASLCPIGLAELRLLPEGRSWPVDQHLADLESLSPVRGDVHARHLGTAVEVWGRAQTIVTLCCDRCLQDYNHHLSAEARELIELDGELLDPAGSFDPERWLFEQLSLRLPLVNRCGSDCPGPPQWDREPEGPDPRWAVLSRLRPD